MFLDYLILFYYLGGNNVGRIVLEPVAKNSPGAFKYQQMKTVLPV